MPLETAIHIFQPKDSGLVTRIGNTHHGSPIIVANLNGHIANEDPTDPYSYILGGPSDHMHVRPIACYAQGMYAEVFCIWQPASYVMTRGPVVRVFGETQAPMGCHETGDNERLWPGDDFPALFPIPVNELGGGQPSMWVPRLSADFSTPAITLPHEYAIRSNDTAPRFAQSHHESVYLGGCVRLIVLVDQPAIIGGSSSSSESSSSSSSSESGGDEQQQEENPRILVCVRLTG